MASLGGCLWSFLRTVQLLPPSCVFVVLCCSAWVSLMGVAGSVTESAATDALDMSFLVTIITHSVLETAVLRVVASSTTVAGLP